MARLAPRESAPIDRPAPRFHLKSDLAPGVVTFSDRQFAVVARRLEGDAGWLAFRLCAQTGPLHRSHVILSPRETSALFFATPLADRSTGRVIIRTADPVLVSDTDRVVGRVDDLVLDRVRAAWLRDRQASILEDAAHGVA